VEKRWSGSGGMQPFAVQSRSWYEAGARLIGGCCRTTPQDIVALCTEHRDRDRAGTHTPPTGA